MYFMKKVLLAGLLTLCTSISAQAETALGFYAGSALWKTDADGSIEVPELGGYTIDMDKSTLTDENNSMHYFAIEHPVTGLPNFRITQTNIKHEGQGSFSYFGQTSTIKGEVDLGHTDFTFYYKPVNNIFVLDLGATIRVFDGHLKVDFSDQETPLDSTFALLYIKAAAEFPFGLNFGIDINYGDQEIMNDLSFDAFNELGITDEDKDEKGLDINTFIQYESPLGIGISAGYRSLDTDIGAEAKAFNKTYDATVEFKINGPYLSIIYHH